MRISDDRYSRERTRMELALRFLRHEARTQTIRAWTGLSDDRIRKLYRSYMSQARRQLPRHRGKSPHQIAYFTRSLRLQEEAALLASMLSLLGVVPAGPASTAGAAALPGVARGELLCQAFEAFLVCCLRHRSRSSMPCSSPLRSRVAISCASATAAVAAA